MGGTVFSLSNLDVLAAIDVFTIAPLDVEGAVAKSVVYVDLLTKVGFAGTAATTDDA